MYLSSSYILAGAINQRSRQNIPHATEDVTKPEEWQTIVNGQVVGPEWCVDIH